MEWLWIAVLAAVLFAASLAVTAAILIRLPADYFARPVRPLRPAGGWTPLRLAAVAARNLAGIVLVLLGVLLSLPGVPGQGLLTILIGLFLIDFPGKYRLERKIIGQRSIRRWVNRLRARAGRPPFQVPNGPAP
jgi:hypothetical protein